MIDSKKLFQNQFKTCLQEDLSLNQIVTFPMNHFEIAFAKTFSDFFLIFLFKTEKFFCFRSQINISIFNIPKTMTLMQSKQSLSTNIFDVTFTSYYSVNSQQPSQIRHAWLWCMRTAHIWSTSAPVSISKRLLFHSISSERLRLYTSLLLF